MLQVFGWVDARICSLFNPGQLQQIQGPAAFDETAEGAAAHSIKLALQLLAKLRLIRLVEDKSTGRLVEVSNMTILNLWLVWRGPLREDRLAWEITAMQTALGLFGLFVRHKLALLVFREDNLTIGRIPSVEDGGL